MRLIIRSLLPSERTDLLKGTLILLTCFCMSLFDASRVYHAIRGQSSIKLYVLFNVLDVDIPSLFHQLLGPSNPGIDRRPTRLFNRPGYLRRNLLQKRCRSGTTNSIPTSRQMAR